MDSRRDVYQLNFTAPFHVEASGSVAALYARLRARQRWTTAHFCIGNRAGTSFPSRRNYFSASKRRPYTAHCDAADERHRASRRTTREDREIAEWLRSDRKIAVKM